MTIGQRNFSPTVIATTVAICILVIAAEAFAGSAFLRAVAVESTLKMTALLPPQDAMGRTNVLLLGVGDKEHSASNLTDSMIIASIEPKTASVVMLSIPRDLYVPDGTETGHGRINSLYDQYRRRFARQSATGSSLLAMHALAADMSARTGVPIAGVMKMDFTGFVDIVDAAGGVDVNVPKKILDRSYPVKEGTIGTFELEAGAQHLDGETALKYARSRHGSSDFDRSFRQQQIIAALTETMKRKNIVSDMGMVFSLQDSLQNHFETTFSLQELLGIGSLATLVKSDSIVRMNLSGGVGSDYSDALPGGFMLAAPVDIAGSGALLVPYSLSGKPDDWGQIRTLASLLFDHRELYTHHLEIRLQSNGARQLEVHRLENELVRSAMTVTVESKKDSAMSMGSHIVSEWKNSAGATFLGKTLKLPVVWSRQTHGENTITIVLGSDYKFTEMEKLLK